MLGLDTSEQSKLEEREAFQDYIDNLLRESSDKNWQKVDAILEAARRYEDDYQDFFTGGAYNMSEGTINILRHVGNRFPPSNRQWQCDFGFYRDLYSTRNYSDEVVATLLSRAERGEYENREQFRADKRAMVGKVETTPYIDSCLSQNLSVAMTRALKALDIPDDTDIEIKATGNVIRIKVNRLEAVA